jgi:hypothetical protein
MSTKLATNKFAGKSAAETVTALNRMLKEHKGMLVPISHALMRLESLGLTHPAMSEEPYCHYRAVYKGSLIPEVIPLAPLKSALKVLKAQSPSVQQAAASGEKFSTVVRDKFTGEDRIEQKRFIDMTGKQREQVFSDSGPRTPAAQKKVLPPATKPRGPTPTTMWWDGISQQVHGAGPFRFGFEALVPLAKEAGWTLTKNK